MAISTDPNVTRNREIWDKGKSLRFPLTEDLQAGTILRFAKYNRFSPSSSPAIEDNTTIFLPLPDAIPKSSTFNISGLDLGIAGLIDQGKINTLASTSGEGFKGVVAAAAEAGASAVTNLIEGNQKIANSSLLRGMAAMPMLPDTVRRNIQVYAGFVQNPHSTLAFEGVNLRGINLQWRLSPRSAAEADALKKILDEIEYRSHPEESTERLTLDYPDMLYVEFTGKPAEHLPKYKKAFINEIAVNAGGSAGLNFYKDGAPTEVTFSIRATELDIITRNVLRGER